MEQRGVENRKRSPKRRQKNSRKPNAVFHIIKVTNEVSEIKVQLVGFVGAATCVGGGHAEQVVEGVERHERGVVRVVAAHDSLVVVGVGEAGHVEVEFLSDAHRDKVGDDLEARLEGAHAVPDHFMGARLRLPGGRNLGGCGLVELMVPAFVLQVRWSPLDGTS